MISFINGEAQIIIEENCFNRCISEKNGGSLYINHSKHILIEKCIFQFGKAVLGGAIYLEDNKRIF